MKKQRIKIAAIILTLAITFIAHPFLYVYAAATNHGHQTFTGGRLEWEINTYDAVQDVTVNGTTFRAGGIIILNYYFTNTSTGTLRVNWSGFNVGWYNAMNVYTFGATISAITTASTSGITLKMNNATDRVTVVISFNATDMNTSLESITSFINTPSLTTSTNNTQSSLSSIDVKLSNMSFTLSQIYDLINADNGDILNYLDEITAYAEYLRDINLKLDDLDNQIDTISWTNMPINYKGATTDYVNFNTNYTNGVGYYYTYENVTINQSNEHAIFKFNIPIMGVFTPDMIKFYTRTQRGWYLLNPEIMVYRTQFEMTIYFILDNSSQNFIENQIFAIFINNDRINQYRADLTYSLDYLDQSDIEYWTIRNAMYSNANYLLLQSIVNGDTDNSAANDINDITDQLNQSINDSNQAQESINDMMDDFKLNFDLNNYKFTFDDDFINYYKMKLTDLYDIQELRPFYIIPLVLFILWRLLSG